MRNLHYRTGVFRTTLTLAKKLSTAPGCQLSFQYPGLLDFDDTSFRAFFPQLGQVPLIPNGSAARSLGQTLYRKAPPILRAVKQSPKLDTLLRMARRLYRPAPKPAKHLERIDIFHSSLTALPEASRAVPGLKRFITVYDLVPILHRAWCDSTSYFHAVMQSLSPTDWIVCVSENTRRDLCDFHRRIDPARVFVVPLAADTEVFYPCTDAEAISACRGRYGIPAGPYLMALNTLEPRKNMDHVIDCFVRLVNESKIHDLSLVLCGPNGWRTGKVERALTRASHLQHRIVVTGFVAEEDLAPLYSGALAFLYPSLYEGFGLPPLEAMQCGAPVITANTSALPEVVGEAAIMLDPKDSDGLCQAMLDIYEKPDLRRDLSRRSLERARHFTWQRCVDDIIAAYRTANESPL